MKTHMLGPDEEKTLCGRWLKTLSTTNIKAVDCSLCLHIYSDLSIILMRIENYMVMLKESYGECTPDQLLPYINKELLLFKKE